MLRTGLGPAQGLKSLRHEHEALSLDPENPCRSQVWQAYDPSLGEEATKGSLGLLASQSSS